MIYQLATLPRISNTKSFFSRLRRSPYPTWCRSTSTFCCLSPLKGDQQTHPLQTYQTKRDTTYSLDVRPLALSLVPPLNSQENQSSRPTSTVAGILARQTSGYSSPRLHVSFQCVRYRSRRRRGCFPRFREWLQHKHVSALLGQRGMRIMPIQQFVSRTVFRW